ncbi:MAG TPA: lysophospholipid acyltransferase family protein [Actinomycetota bacterium]|nr:lysophospholipid acyltransferase family protein [Actinomycetota bacterium]
MPLPPSTGRLQVPAAALVRLFVRPYFRLRIEGAGNVPSAGPVIVAPNHDSMWDVPILGVASLRPLVFMAKEEVFGNPFKRWVFTELGGFPVRRGKGDTGAIGSALEVLAAGRALAVFPEGTRTAGGLGRFRSGTARLALESGAPIVPVGIGGTEGIWPRGAMFPRRSPVRVVFGKPLEFGATHDPDPRRLRDVTESLRVEVERLLET